MARWIQQLVTLDIKDDDLWLRSHALIMLSLGMLIIAICFIPLLWIWFNELFLTIITAGCGIVFVLVFLLARSGKLFLSSVIFLATLIGGPFAAIFDGQILLGPFYLVLPIMVASLILRPKGIGLTLAITLIGLLVALLWFAYQPDPQLPDVRVLVGAFLIQGATALMGFLGRHATRAAMRSAQSARQAAEQAVAALEHARQHLEQRVAKRTSELQIALDTLRQRESHLRLALAEAHTLAIELEQRNRDLQASLAERKQAEEALRQAEKRYRDLFEEAPVMYVITRNYGGQALIADCNGAFARTLGYARTALLNQPLADFYTPASRERLLKGGYQQALDGRFAVEERELVTSDGRIIQTLLHALPETDANGAVSGTRAMFIDITERKRAEAALEEERALLARRVAERTADLSAANAELARAARLKDEFLASMSHELRTPLNAILGLSEALQEHVYGPLNSQQVRILQHIEESGRHLLELINDILDLAKIGAGKMELDLESVALEPLCQASLRLVNQAAHKKHIRIETAFDPRVGLVRVDARRLKQILVNLLSNAIKFTPEGGRVGLEMTGDPVQQVVTLTVWDTGIGIAKDDLARLAQPFVQLDGTLSRRYEGTGLGLALVYRMVELHGGSIAVASELGVGSRFTVSLPWQITAMPEGDEAMRAVSPVANPSPPIRQALIIEDSPTARDQIVRYLTEAGVATVTHPRGADAAARALEVQPDLIVLDLLLPDTSGWNVLAQLKADPRVASIPVVIVSVVDSQSAGAGAGAAAYLVKPFTRQDVLRVLQQVASPAQDTTAQTPRLGETQPRAAAPVILLAEDNETNIASISDYLSTKGYQVVVARNGAEAIARAREVRPDLILMDIQMPGMDGLEATRRIRTDSDLAEVPIIALTALAMPGDRERCIAAGADHYFSKPVSLKRLAAVIEAYVRPASTRQDSRIAITGT